MWPGEAQIVDAILFQEHQRRRDDFEEMFQEDLICGRGSARFRERWLRQGYCCPEKCVGEVST